MPYKPVRNRVLYDTLYTSEYAHKPYNDFDTVVNHKHLNTAVIDWLIMMEDTSYFDDFMLQEFKDQFSNWSTDLLAEIDVCLRKAVKEFLRARGIFLPLNAKDSVATQFTTLLGSDECPSWPEKDLKMAMEDPGFRCRQSIEIRNRQNQFSNLTKAVPTVTPQAPTTTTQQTTPPGAPPGAPLGAPPPPQPPRTQPTYPPYAPHPSVPPPQPSHTQSAYPSYAPPLQAAYSPFAPPPHGAAQTYPNSARALTDLTKMYTDDSKYSGDLHDVLSMKLNIFYDYCSKAGVPEDQYHHAFGTMLRGKARDFYYQHLSQKGYDFQEMVSRMKQYFHTPENHQLFLSEWRNTTLTNTKASHPDKSLKQCLEIVIEQLQRTYQGLTQNFGLSDQNLASQLVNACQGEQACAAALIRPATTFEGVAAELRNAVGVWERCQPSSSFNNEKLDQDTYYTDRRYNRNRPPFQPRQDRRPNRYNGRFDSNKDDRQPFKTTPRNNKKCFVCGKQGCWSTRHPPDERARSRRRYQSYAQDHEIDMDFDSFLADFEGIDFDNDDMTNGSNDDRDYDLHTHFATQQFNTSTCGPLDGQLVTTKLNNAATTHALTGADPYKEEAAEKPHLFTFDHRYGAGTFQGIMPDTGAAGVSTAGKTQVLALQQLQPHAKIDESTAGRHRIRFGDNPECVSIGDVRVLTPFGSIKFAVMPTNTPFLLCLADMDHHGVYLNNVKNELVHKDKTYPVIRKWGHPWLLLDDNETAIYYLTDTELRQLHRRFGHPSAERLYKVLSKAGHDDVSKDVIEDITKFCHQCQLHGKAPGRFKFTLRDDADFNARVIVDVMYLNQRPVLHAIDEATAFQAARFLTNMTATTTWDTLRAMWIDMYVGPPDMISTDAGKNFIAKDFVDSAKSMAIEINEVPVEAHNSIGKVERYHAVIRRAYEVIHEEIGRSTASEHVLQMAVKAVNDTAGPNGLVPTLLVFGTYPRLTETSPPSPSVTARATAIHKAMDEIRRLRASRQVADALATRNGPDVIETLELPIMSSVKVWREHKGWTGPYTLLALTNDKTAATVEIDGRQVNFRVTSVRPYHQDESTTPPPDQNEPDEHREEIEDQQDDDEYAPPPQEPPKKRGRGRPKGSKNKPKIVSEQPHETHLTQREENDRILAQELRRTGKITTPGEPFELSTKAEIDGLIARGVFRFETFDPYKHGGNRIFKSRIVNEVKGKTTDRPYEKSRLVIQGYNDDDKKIVLTQSPTIQRASQRLIIALAPSLIAKGMILWLRDITQAYTQSDDPLQRTIIADLPVQLQKAYPKGTVMTVIKPLYGIAEAGAYWWSTYHKHHTEKLEMETSTYDPCLLITKSSADGVGIVGMQTDDTLGLSDQLFADKESQELRFSAKDKQQLNKDSSIDFNGCVVTIDEHGVIKLRQKRQGDKLEAATDQKSYIQQRARGAYIATICQPQASFDLAAAAQTTDPSKEEISRLNKRIMWQKENVTKGLTYEKLDMTKLKLFTMVDASFANNKDMSSQMGYIIVLGNEIATTNSSFRIRGNIVHWSSIKCKRITRSVLASEIYAMAHGVDIAISIGSTINRIMDRLMLNKVPIVVCTDSLSLYECLVKLGTTKEKRLMIDILALREAYERGELNDIRWIDGRDNPADAMTKSSSNAAMESLIDTNELELHIQGWVNRGKGQMDN